MAGRDGGRLLNKTWWLALCRDCHLWVTEHPAEAVEQGYSLSRVAKPYVTCGSVALAHNYFVECDYHAFHDGLHSWEPETVLDGP